MLYPLPDKDDEKDYDKDDEKDDDKNEDSREASRGKELSESTNFHSYSYLTNSSFF